MAASPRPALSIPRLDTAHPRRTSQALREILTKNPKARSFRIKRIIESIEGDRIGTALVLFSLPKIVEAHGVGVLAGVPTCLIAGQTAFGKTAFRLPRFILKRCVPRRALAVMIHSVLPTLELAENAARPRWQWMSHPSSRWVVGLIVFLLSLAVAIPILGFAIPHAASMFTISLGMAEQDGVVVMIGLLAGLASLGAAIGGVLSGRALLARAGDWLKSFILEKGLNGARSLLRKINAQWANLLDLDWRRLLLFWDPEESSKAPPAQPAAHMSKFGTMIETRRKAARTTPSCGAARPRIDRMRQEPFSRAGHEKRQAV